MAIRDNVVSREDADVLDSILRNRALPGVLVFDSKGTLEFINQDARRMLAIINTKSHVSEEGEFIPEEIHELYRAARDKEGKDEFEAHCPGGTIFCNGDSYAIRAVDLYRVQTNDSPERVMVIIDKCSMSRSIKVDLDAVQKRFGLTDRELQVTEAIVTGATNSEISERLMISEHTVKDYVKRIIRKTGVKNRSSILCRIMG